MPSAKEYIWEMRVRGFSDQQIANKLLESGMDQESIQKAFSVAKTPEQTTPEEPQPVKTEEPVTTVPVTTVIRPEEAMSKWSQKPADLENKSFVERSKLIFFQPEKFFSSDLGAPLKVPVLHYLLISILFLIIPFISTASSILLGDIDMMSLVILLISPIIFLILSALTSIVFHIIARILGGKAGFSTTFKIFLYYPTISIPMLIPIFNLFFLPFLILYAPYVMALAFSKTHKISMMRAYTVLTIPMILLVILFAAIIFLASAMLMSLIIPIITSSMVGGLPLPITP
jgi:hypothetical protein